MCNAYFFQDYHIISWHASDTRVAERDCAIFSPYIAVTAPQGVVTALHRAVTAPSCMQAATTFTVR